jgi:hypothetical protein
MDKSSVSRPRLNEFEELFGKFSVGVFLWELVAKSGSVSPSLFDTEIPILI